MGARYDVLRLRFDRQPPADLSLVLKFADGSEHAVSSGAIEQARYAQVATSELFGVIVDILAPDIQEKVVNFTDLRRVEFISPSCQETCEVRILELSRDGFSRRTALIQAPVLEAWNVRPFIYTSHGSQTKNASFGTALLGVNAVAAEASTSAIDTEVTPLAANPTRHAYLVDILKRLGVGSVWPFEVSGYLYSANIDTPPANSFDGFHVTRRTWPFWNPATSIDEYKNNIFKKFPNLSRDLIEKIIVCKTTGPCSMEQGTVIGLLPAISLSEITRRAGVEHLWYTHFGTAPSFGQSFFNSTPDQPFPAANSPPFATLTNRFYNFSGLVPKSERVWVAPAGTVERYRRMHHQIGGLLRYRRETQTVEIRSWLDPVLATRVPDRGAGTRDLHGLTVYVEDASRSRVTVDDQEIDSFTRNSADASGRESITVVDDSAPTVLIGKAPLESRGIAIATQGHLIRGAHELSLETGADKRAAFIFVPNELKLWNTSHIKIRYRKSGPGRAYITLTLQDGQLLSLGEGDSPSLEASGYLSMPEAASEEWVSSVLSLADADWLDTPDAKDTLDSGQRLPLPLGQIRQIEVELRDAAENSRLSIEYLHALRPNGNGVAPDGRKVVAGRVANADGEPLSNVTVEASDGDGTARRTATDRDGLYFFPAISIGSVLRLRLPYTNCYPDRGSAIEVLKDEVEVDFDTGRCDYSRSQGLQTHRPLLTPTEIFSK
jgi:hypothetical protein